MSKVRCKDCQYFDGVQTCHRYEGLGERKIYDECIEYEQLSNYRSSNHKDRIKYVVNEVTNLINEERCFFNPEEHYKLEMLTRKLLNLVEAHGVHSWKYNLKKEGK